MENSNKTVALIGRPNVGKSTLFNRLIGRREAIETPIPGTTRDRLFGEVSWRGQEFDLVDVAGIEFGSKAEIDKNTQEGASLAIENADLILFLVDWNEKDNEADRRIARTLRGAKKPVILVANKCDNLSRLQSSEEFQRLGNFSVVPVSAISGKSTGDLLDIIVEKLQEDGLNPKVETKKVKNKTENESKGEIKLAIIGRPNVGKSTLINTIVGEKRAIVSEVPGTTRDAIAINFMHKGHNIELLDTAGIRRRGKIVKDTIESFAMLRTYRALKECDIAVLLIDAEEGLVANDTHILGMAKEWGKGLVLAVNKIDVWKEADDAPEGEVGAADDADAPTIAKSAKPGTREAMMSRTIFTLQKKLNFTPWLPIVFISAKDDENIKPLLNQVIVANENRKTWIPQDKLNEILIDAKSTNNQIYNILSLTQKRSSPPTFEAKYTKKAPHETQLRYLENKIRDWFPLEGSPMFLDLISGKNRRD